MMGVVTKLIVVEVTITLAILSTCSLGEYIFATRYVSTAEALNTELIKHLLDSFLNSANE